MTDIDAKIRDALNAEDRAELERIDQQAGLFELVGMTFRGKQAWMAWYMWIAGFAVFLLGLYFLSLFFAAAELKTSLAWALAIIACMFVLAIIKVLSWQQMQKMELMREIKRLELRLLARETERN